MTRQEAIKHLKEIQATGNLSDETLSTYSDAIFVLECWDGIEDTLDKVLKIIDGCSKGGDGSEWCDGYDDACFAIKTKVLALKDGEHAED